MYCDKKHYERAGDKTKQGYDTRVPTSCETDKKLWNEILEEATCGSPAKMKRLLTLIPPEKEEDADTNVISCKEEELLTNLILSKEEGEKNDKIDYARKDDREIYKMKLKKDYENLVGILVEMNDEMEKPNSPPPARQRLHL